MAVISSLGIGSGLDISSLVTNLMDAEREPATQRLDGQQAGFEAKLSALGRLKGALADFQASQIAIADSRLDDRWLSGIAGLLQRVLIARILLQELHNLLFTKDRR